MSLASGRMKGVVCSHPCEDALNILPPAVPESVTVTSLDVFVREELQGLFSSIAGLVWALHYGCTAISVYFSHQPTCHRGYFNPSRGLKLQSGRWSCLVLHAEMRSHDIGASHLPSTDSLSSPAPAPLPLLLSCYKDEAGPPPS